MLHYCTDSHDVKKTTSRAICPCQIKKPSRVLQFASGTMALRELITGSDICTPGDGAGPSNAAGALADTLLGRGAKNQEQLRDVRAHSHAPTSWLFRVFVNMSCILDELLYLITVNPERAHSIIFAAAWNLWQWCRSVIVWSPASTVSQRLCEGSC